MDIHNQTQLSQINQLSISVIDASNKHVLPIYNIHQLAKTIPNLTKHQHYLDYQFKLPANKQNSIVIKRLSEIYPPMTNIFLDLKTGKQLSQPTKNKINHFVPTYLSQINMLPFRHYCKLIQPAFVNQLGFYHVTILKEGVLVKQIIDDRFYFQEKTNKIVTHPQLQDHLWVHILIKAWAKVNQGYQNLNKCSPFEFIKTFSFPDWQVINPNKQKTESLICKLSKATSKNQLLITKTKNNKNVGLFGFAPNCSSYVIKSHYQQYGNIFIKMKPFVTGGWNSLNCKKEQIPEEVQHLQQNQFMIPLAEYLNSFHLIYATTDKYFRSDQSYSFGNQQNDIAQQVNYQKYILHTDAMDGNADVLGFDIESKDQTTQQYQVALCFYFPEVNMNDLIRNNENKPLQNQAVVVPWSKLMIGKIMQFCQNDPNYVQSVKEKMMYCQQQDHMSFTVQTRQHDYILGDYFKGYARQATYILNLKPGKYLIRLKMQQKKIQYRCFISAVTINCTAKFYDPKQQIHEQLMFLQDCLFKKAANEKKCLTFVNPTKRGSWISCRNQFQALGYSYIAVYVIKNADNKILIKIQPTKLKQNGFKIKGHRDLKDYQLLIDAEQSTVIIIKKCNQWNQQTTYSWPPPGIQFVKIPRITSRIIQNNVQTK